MLQALFNALSGPDSRLRRVSSGGRFFFRKVFMIIPLNDGDAERSNPESAH